jgi:cytochrome c biogenesis protein CcdA/thiol-disulfide isomerase/thioredoxin
MLSFLALSFVAGALTVLAPCILPLLPVILGRSISERAAASRIFTIVASLGVSVYLFTLLLKVSSAFISIPQGFWQGVSGGLLVFFGLATLFPRLWDAIPGTQALYRSSNRVVGSGYERQGLIGDIMVGAALGPVFSSCSPTYFVILATVLPVSLKTGLLYLLAYVLGMCLFLFLLAIFGQKAADRLGFLADDAGWFKKLIAVAFIAVGIAVWTGLDKKAAVSLPSFFENGLEERFLANKEDMAGAPAPESGQDLSKLTITEKSSRYPKAPELVSPEGYINTNGEKISIGQFKGQKIVLIDFWTYSCINCQRTIPYLNAWYEKYKDQGLVIIGVHTPEFAFEKVLANVEKAVGQFGIEYPVVQDNQYQTWGAFKNSYWPRKYLIDIDGYVVYDHAGEGNYAETEKAIQAALAERAERLGLEALIPKAAAEESAPPKVYSPETYFGASRNEYLGNGAKGRVGAQTLSVPETIEPNTLYLGGAWRMYPEYAEAGAGASIVFQYGARDVYFVASAKNGPAEIEIYRDGRLAEAAGPDADPRTGIVVVDGDGLYKIVHDPEVDVHTLEIRIKKGTLEAYTFTFG